LAYCCFCLENDTVDKQWLSFPKTLVTLAFSFDNLQKKFNSNTKSIEMADIKHEANCKKEIILNIKNKH